MSGPQCYDLDSSQKASIVLPLKAEEALGLARDRESLWVGTSRGVLRRPLSSGTWQRFRRKNGLPHPVVSALGADPSARTVWCATGRGLARFDQHRKRWMGIGPPQQLIHNAVNDMVLDAQGNTLWFGTDGGGISGYHRGTGSWQTITAEDGLPSDQVRSLEWQNVPRRLWARTLAHRVASFAPGPSLAGDVGIRRGLGLL